MADTWSHQAGGRQGVHRSTLKSDKEIMEILEAFDLTRSARAAGALCRVSHHTELHHVARRDAGLSLDERVRRERLVDPFLDKIEEWVERSEGRIRADVAHDRLRRARLCGIGAHDAPGVG